MEPPLSEASTEEEELGKPDTHRIDQGKEGRMKATRNIFDETEQMDGRIRSG